MSWPVPTDKHQLRSLLGLHTYYMMFIDGFVLIEQPLMRQTKGKQKFECSAGVDTAFRSLKEVLSTAPVLRHPETGKQRSIGACSSPRGDSSWLGGIRRRDKCERKKNLGNSEWELEDQ